MLIFGCINNGKKTTKITKSFSSFWSLNQISEYDFWIKISTCIISKSTFVIKNFLMSNFITWSFEIRFNFSLRIKFRYFRLFGVILITRPQSTNPKYLKNAESQHLIGWSFLNLTNEIGLFRNQGFWLGANILRCLYHSNI